MQPAKTRVVITHEHPMTINTPTLILALLLLSSCGDDYASYEKPAHGISETAWHRCMRQSNPIGRSAKCQDLR